jgi:autotransporter-associated beta strand protein
MGNGAGEGIYNLSGGSLTFSASPNRGIFLGTNAGRSGTFNLSGSGAINMAATSLLAIGRSDGGADTGTSGYFNQLGGLARVGSLRMGGAAAGASGTTAELNLSGGTFSAVTFDRLSVGNTSSSAINISGMADVTLPAFPLAGNTLGSGSTAVITFDGGTLKNSAASANYLGVVTGALIKAGGARINTTNGTVTITQALQEDPLSTGGGLTKEGANILTLGTTNSYSGATTINGGTLQVGVAGVVNPVTIGNFGFESPVQTTPGYTYTPSGASWTFTGAGVAKNTFFVNTPPQGVQAGFLQSAASSVSQAITVGADGFYRIAFQAQGRGAALGPLGIIVRVDGATVGSWDHTAISQSQWFNYSASVYLAAGSHTLTFLGNNTAGGDKSSSIDNVQMNQPTGSLPATTAVNLTAPGATLDLNGTTQTIGSLAGVAGSSVTNGNLIVGGADSTTFAGVLSGGGGLTLTGAGSLTLTGANTYTGASTLNAGTLALGADNVLPNLSDVSIGAATLDAAGFDDTMGTLDITAAATLNLGTGANLVFDGATATWAGTLNITGTFVSGSSLNFGIGGLTPAQLAQITVNGGGGPFSLDGAGYLVSGGGPTGFAAWQAANSTAGGIDEDHDNDGVRNGIEHFLAGPAPSAGFTTLPAITPDGNTFSITWTKSGDYFGIYNTDYMVETSATLAGPWTTETPGVNVTISGNNITYTFPLPLGAKNFARLKVTGP